MFSCCTVLYCTVLYCTVLCCVVLQCAGSWEEEETDSYGSAHPYRLSPCDAATSNHSSVAFAIPLQAGGAGEGGGQPYASPSVTTTLLPSSSADSSSESLRSPHVLVSPEAIGTHILTHLKALTAAFLGHAQVCQCSGQAKSLLAVHSLPHLYHGLISSIHCSLLSCLCVLAKTQCCCFLLRLLLLR